MPDNAEIKLWQVSKFSLGKLSSENHRAFNKVGETQHHGSNNFGEKYNQCNLYLGLEVQTCMGKRTLK